MFSISSRYNEVELNASMISSYGLLEKDNKRLSNLASSLRECFPNKFIKYGNFYASSPL